MKPQAIVYLLWDKNIEVLKAHVARIPGTTVLYYSPLAQCSVSIVQSAAGLRAVDLLSLSDTNREESGRAQLANAKSALAQHIQSPNWRTACRAAGVDAGRVADQIQVMGEGYWERTIQLLQCLDAALERYDVRVALLNEDVTDLGRVVASWGRRTGVKTVMVQHSVALATCYTAHRGLFADVTAMFGMRGMDAYLDIGVAPERMVVTGNPAWDRYPALRPQRQRTRQALFARHGLDPNKPTVVFGTTWAANLTAHCNPKAYDDTLLAFLHAVQVLRQSHPTLQAVIKDRVSNESLFHLRFEQIVSQLGLPVEAVRYATTDTEGWVVSADVVVAVDSNLAVEAMLADTPAVNVCNVPGLMVGPPFEAETGICDVEPSALAPAIARLLDDGAWREHCLNLGKRRRGHYNDAGQESAAIRVAELLESVGQFRLSAPGYVWQEYLNVNEIDATAYHGGARADLVEMFGNNPRLVLDIGCAAGGTGELLKRKFPHCKVWGVETNRAAANVAAKRLDRVLVGMFEEFDLEAEGIAKGSLDGVILADVLEHMYNPWAVMTALHPYLSTTAQVIISIPNVRNLKLMEDMAAGFWRYEPAGLLDITHIRFFTLKEFRRFLHETGYHVNQLRYGIDQRLAPFFSANRHLVRQDIELGRMRLSDVSKEELGELCSLQFYINAGLGALDEDIRPYHANAPYAEYLQRCRLSKAEAQMYDALIAQWAPPPSVAILIKVGSETEASLTATVQNLRQQLYQYLSIWVVSPQLAPAGVPLSDRFNWLTTDGGLAGALNTVASSSDTDWLAWLDAGDLLEPQAVLRFVEAAHRQQDWRFIYSDEDEILSAGEFGTPVHKPDFDPQYLLSMPYLGGLCAVRRDAVLALGGVSAEVAGAEQIDLALRCWQRWGASSVGHVASVLYHRTQQASTSLAAHINAAQRAANRLLQGAGVAAEMVPGWHPGVFRWQATQPTTALVSLLMPVRDNLTKLQRTLESLLAHTQHAAFEILLVDNGSTDEAMLTFLRGVDALGDPRLKVFRLLDRVGLPKLFNLLATQAQGAYLGLMHFDCTPLDASWLDVLLGEMQRPGVGIVAPRLLDGQGKLRGGGVVLGIDGGYAPAFAGLTHNDAGPWGRAHCAQAFSGATGGMLLIRRELFTALNGLRDEMGVAAEVDFCLRAGEAGYQTLWTPYASLMTDGTVWSVDWLGLGRPVSGEKIALDDPDAVALPLLEHWLPRMSADPAYSPNLTRVGVPFSVEIRPVMQRPVLGWKPLPRLLVHPADNSGCGYYRIVQPATALKEANLAETLVTYHLLHPTDLQRLEVDAVVFQRQVHEPQVRRMRQARQLVKPFMVFELDDLITNVPSKNLHRDAMPSDTQRWLREACGLCDRFIVSTEPLAHAMRAYNEDIRVVRNTIDPERWTKLAVARHHGGKPRVGWAGGVSHSGDLEVILDVVKELANEVEWVFFGMCPDNLRPYVAEFYPGVTIEKYPAKLASLGLDLALAPLEFNAFNESKSNLKLLEYGALGYPVICTDIVPYQCNLPVVRVKNRFRDWVAAIREHLADRQALAMRGQLLKSAVLADWTIEQHLDEWLAAWQR